MPTLDEALAMLSDVTARLNRVESQATPQNASQPSQPSSGGISPFWWVTYQKGLTLTTGTALDWDPLFDPASSWPRGRKATSGGEFDQGNLGTAFQKRIVISWDAAAASTVLCWIGGTSVYNADADANIQVKHNGVMTEYVAGAGPDLNVARTFSLSVVAGRNRLAISADTHPDTLQFFADLFDETRGDKFIDPRGFSDHLRSTT